MSGQYIQYTNLIPTGGSTVPLTGVGYTVNTFGTAETACAADQTCLAFDSTYMKYQVLPTYPSGYTPNGNVNTYVKVDTSELVEYALNYTTGTAAPTPTYPSPFPYVLTGTGLLDNLADSNYFQVYDNSWVLWSYQGGYVAVDLSSGLLTFDNTRENATPFFMQIAIFQTSGPTSYVYLNVANVLGDGTVVQMPIINNSYDNLQAVSGNTNTPYQFAYTYSTTSGIQLTGLSYVSGYGKLVYTNGSATGSLEIIVQTDAARIADYVNSNQFPPDCCAGNVSDASIATSCSAYGYTSDSASCQSAFAAYCVGINVSTPDCQAYCAASGNCVGVSNTGTSSTTTTGIGSVFTGTGSGMTGTSATQAASSSNTGLIIGVVVAVVVVAGIIGVLLFRKRKAASVKA